MSFIVLNHLTDSASNVCCEGTTVLSGYFGMSYTSSSRRGKGCTHVKFRGFDFLYILLIRRPIKTIHSPALSSFCNVLQLLRPAHFQFSLFQSPIFHEVLRLTTDCLQDSGWIGTMTYEPVIQFNCKLCLPLIGYMHLPCVYRNKNFFQYDLFIIFLLCSRPIPVLSLYVTWQSSQYRHAPEFKRESLISLSSAVIVPDNSTACVRLILSL